MRALKVIALVVFALAVLLGGICGALALVFGSRYQSEIAAIRARGEPLTPADLIGARIPDAENAAIVYERIFSELGKEPVLKDLDTLDDFVHRGAAEKDAPTLDEARRALARTEKVLALLEQATSRPSCQLRVDRTDPRLSFAPFEGVKRSAQLLQASALMNACEGRMDQAVRSVDMGFKLVKHLEDEPMLVPQLVRVAILGIASRSIRDALAYGDISEAQARRLFDTLARIDAARGFVRAWQGERVTFVTTAEMFSRGAPSPAPLPGGPSVRPALKTLSRPFGSLYTHTIWRGDQAAYLRFMARQIEGVNLSYKEARSRGLFERHQDLPPYAIMSKILAPVFARAGVKRYSMEAEAAGMQVFLALQAYKARYGSYPRTLGELKAKLGWKLPKDPFSGKDFVYKRQKKGFLLYSIGPDLKDDGGLDTKPSGYPPKPGDIVWKWER